MTLPACPIYAGYRFPAEIISHAVWLYFRFPLSLRMVDGLLAARGIISHETVRQWVELTKGSTGVASEIDHGKASVHAFTQALPAKIGTDRLLAMVRPGPNGTCVTSGRGTRPRVG